MRSGTSSAEASRTLEVAHGRHPLPTRVAVRRGRGRCGWFDEGLVDHEHALRRPPHPLVSSTVRARPRAGPGAPGVGADVTEQGVPTWAEAAARGGVETAPQGRADLDPRLALLDGLNPQQREAVVHDGRPAADHRRRRLGQDPGRSPTASRTCSPSAASRPARSSPSPSPTRPRGRCASGSSASSGPRATAMWVSTFHSACVRILRREAGARRLRRRSRSTTPTTPSGSWPW